MTRTDEPRILEIRTHGVSGTPAHDILADAAGPVNPGDLAAVPGPHAPDRGFVRLVDAHRRPVPASDNPNHHVWAYHWGRLTSGGWKKSLWAVLVPFALINTAHAMLPDHAADFWSRTRRAVVRLLGLSLTVLFTLQISAVAYDTLAYQCFGPERPSMGSACLASTPFGNLFRGEPVRLAWASTAIVLLLLLIGAIVTKTTSFDTDGVPQREDATSRKRGNDLSESGCGLERDDFYDGDLTAPILRTAHGAAAPSAVVLMILVVGENGRSAGWWAPVAFLGLLAVALAVVDLLPRTWLLGVLGASTVRLVVKVLGWIIGIAPYVAAVWLTATVLPSKLEHPATGSPDGPVQNAEEVITAPAATGLAGSSIPILAALIACAGLCVVLFVVLPIRARTPIGHSADASVPKAYRTWLRGYTPFVLAGIGVLLGAGLGAGLARVVALLGNGTRDDGSALRIHVPMVYDVLALQWGLAGVALAVVVVAFVMLAGSEWMWGPADRHGSAAVAERLSDTGPRLGHKTDRAVRNLRLRVWIATLNQRASVFVCGLFTIVLAAVVLAALYQNLLADRPGVAVFGSVLRNIGAFLLLGFVAVLGLVIQRAINNPEGFGRNLGVLWDVASFWPREGHPVVPPAYAPLVITDIVERVRAEHRKNPRQQVILCGHSQGSLIMYGAALRLTSGDRPVTNLRLLTYGSQLQWAYGRAFPDYLDFESHRDLLKRLDGRWLNLVRFTDPVGGPVLSWDPVWLEAAAEDPDLGPHPAAGVLDKDAVGVDPRPGTHRGRRAHQPGVIANADPADSTGRTRVLHLGNERWLPDPPIDPQFEFARGHSNYVREPSWPMLLAELVNMPASRTRPDA